MAAWEKAGWQFFTESAKSTVEVDARTRSHSTNVQRAVLIQDYPETGRRTQDVELFTRALYIRKLRHLVEPRSNPEQNLVYYWLHKTYGHLRMGARLLVSSCDFLQLSDADTPHTWRVIMKNVGAMRGLIPNVDQEGASPEVTYTELTYQHQRRTVNVKVAWSLGEVLMEPIFYNPNIAGWWGTRILDSAQWEMADRAAHPTSLFRCSAERRTLADTMYKLSQDFARAGITHVVHI